MKKILSIATVTILLFCMFTVAYASEDVSAEDISLYGVRFTYISDATTSISISGSGQATVTNSITCYSNVDEIKVSTYLQKYSNGGWTTVKHWTDTKNGTNYAGSHSHYVTSGSNYRVLTYFYAYDGTQSESTYLIDYESY